MNRTRDGLAARLRLHNHFRAAAMGACLMFWLMQPAGAQEAEHPCGSLANAFGPYEYRTDHDRPIAGDYLTHAAKIKLVEGAHFTAPVQRLAAGNTAVKPGGDLDYTLRAFPNHHRALAAILEGSRRFSDASVINLPRSFECYFDRAIRFAPDDSVARLLYASFLIDKKRTDEAKKQIEYSETLIDDNPLSHFNVGMIYFDAGEYEKALKQAHVAAALGYPRDDLKKRLQSVGRWIEATPSQGESAASAPALPASAP
jgi:tetratricopeptide (TPR) repeat protein